jgi:hypothetical protein
VPSKRLNLRLLEPALMTRVVTYVGALGWQNVCGACSPKHRTLACRSTSVWRPGAVGVRPPRDDFRSVVQIPLAKAADEGDDTSA